MSDQNEPVKAKPYQGPVITPAQSPAAIPQQESSHYTSNSSNTQSSQSDQNRQTPISPAPSAGSHSVPNRLDDIIPAVVSGNPLLERIQVPGKIFKLPSGGYMYKNGELDPTCKNGEVHVKPLSAIAELKLKNPDLLFSGKAIEEVFVECIPEVKKPLELFGRDIDALMCFIRVVTYGSTYDVDANHGCEGGLDHTYSIDLNNVITKIKELDPTTIGQKYAVTLPNGQQVELEPVRYKHVIKLLQSEENQTPTADEVQANLVDNLLQMINNVDGHTNKEMIKEWISKMPTTYMSKIASSLEKSNDWGPSFEQNVLCADCGKEFVLELPVNPTYFFTE